jgi:hypothetical protein
VEHVLSRLITSGCGFYCGFHGLLKLSHYVGTEGLLRVVRIHIWGNRQTMRTSTHLGKPLTMRTSTHLGKPSMMRTSTHCGKDRQIGVSRKRKCSEPPVRKKGRE